MLDKLDVTFLRHWSKYHFSMCCQDNDGGCKWPFLTGYLKIMFFQFCLRDKKLLLFPVPLSSWAQLLNHVVCLLEAIMQRINLLLS